MKLKKIAYTVFSGDPRYWELKPVELGKINLFVAKNSTGKTKTINTITQLSDLILGSRFVSHANYSVEFDDEDDIYQYTLNIEGMRVISEKLIINKTVMIIRDKQGVGKIYAKQLGNNIEFQLPENRLAISRRDAIQHPFLEPLYKWAANVHYYAFGSSMKQEYGKNVDAPNSIVNGNSDNAVEVFVVGELEFDVKFKEHILSSMSKIGYDLTDVDARPHLFSNNTIGYNEYTLMIVEKDSDTFVAQMDMSQGMFRALSIIIHLTYNVLMGTPTTILIDDIGEGLDFDRSTKLITLLIEIAENNNIQLIMSTNDRYVMNKVPFKYWQVIDRKGGVCKVFNYDNSKSIFDDFEYTGLNNFDFLAYDYINSK
jgi:hypothetical protein